MLTRRDAIAAGALGALGLAAPAVGATPADAVPDDFTIRHGHVRQSVMGWCFKPMTPIQLAKHAKAIGLVIPELAGKLTGGAFRVPTPNGSVTDFSAILNKDTDADEINAKFKEAADGPLKGVLEYSDEPLVLTDIVGKGNIF